MSANFVIQAAEAAARKSHKRRGDLMYQMQIWVEEAGEWYGWGCDQAGFTKAEAENAAKRARRYGWKARVVKIN